jgi:hypothetical protein
MEAYSVSNKKRQQFHKKYPPQLIRVIFETKLYRTKLPVISPKSYFFVNGNLHKIEKHKTLTKPLTRILTLFFYPLPSNASAARK